MRTVILIFVAPLGVLIPLLVGYPWLFRVDRSVDVNSGDVLRQVRICGVQVGETAEATAFSDEMRRLGVQMPEDRRWERLSVQALGGRTLVSYSRDGILTRCSFLVRVMQELDLPHDERIAVLRKALASLEVGDSEGIDSLSQSLAERL